MTVDRIERLKAMIDEYAGTPNPIVSAYEYTNAMNNQVMFAAFTAYTYNDIHESPGVLRPICIYRRGFWIGKYLFMNKVI